MGRTACTEPQCLYKGALYLYLTVELYLYSPYRPYGLYRSSVPVQGCTLPLPYSRAIPLLPLWAVRPVQSLSACTRVHFTFRAGMYKFSKNLGGISNFLTTEGWSYRKINIEGTQISGATVQNIVARVTKIQRFVHSSSSCTVTGPSFTWPPVGML